MMIDRKQLLFEDNEDGPEWVATYHLGYSEFDDDLDSDETTEVIFNAPDFDMAARYAQQYLRKMQSEEETSDSWANAQILSVELR